MNHMKRLSRKDFELRIETFLSLVRAVKPPRAQFVFVPGTAEFESARRDKKYTNKRFHGLLATEGIQLYNNIMFKQLKSDFLNASSNILSFPDLVPITLALEKKSLDGVHFKDDSGWYEAMCVALLDIYCAEQSQRSHQ
jgi:hypothetical protein